MGSFPPFSTCFCTLETWDKWGLGKRGPPPPFSRSSLPLGKIGEMPLLSLNSGHSGSVPVKCLGFGQKSWEWQI